MTVTRRRFIQCALAMGGSLLLPLRTESSQPSKTEPWSPAYERLEKAGRLTERVEQAFAQFSECRLCPRQCGVNRLKGETGFCRAPVRAMNYSAHPHFGEEDALVGRHGSGTIFFSNCNLRCVFCQNWPISHEGRGAEISDEDLAAGMLKPQAIGCHNINLVTPTDVMPNILMATHLACQQGLRIPLLHNTNGYERVEILKLLEGIVDLYLPHLKFMHADKAEEYLEAMARAEEAGLTHLDPRSIKVRNFYRADSSSSQRMK